MEEELDFTRNPTDSLNRMTESHKNIKERAKEAIAQKVGTNLVAIEWMQCGMTPDGVSDVDVMAYIGSDIRPHHFTLYLDKKKEQFDVDVAVDKNLADKFMREFRRFKIDSLTKQELFVLLRKANRRRKSAERKVGKLHGKLRRASDDWLKGVGSRQRTIEEQWEVMRELQRRGLVSTEDLEKVLWDVMKVRRIKPKEGCHDCQHWQDGDDQRQIDRRVRGERIRANISELARETGRTYDETVEVLRKSIPDIYEYLKEEEGDV